MQIHVGIISLDVTCTNDCPNGDDYQRRWGTPAYHYIEFDDPLGIVANRIITVNIDQGKKERKC